MPAPYSGSVIILDENEDGISINIYHWNDVPEGTAMPPTRASLPHLLSQGEPKFAMHTERMNATRALLKSRFAAYVDARFPEVPAS